ncbi:hypothetical protein [Pseudokineococcus marinus]|uniref:hypothetical protein n=1 Tax=Pseudokineococcus marinus TaxID=351215 RepID=UPI0031D195F4
MGASAAVDIQNYFYGHAQVLAGVVGRARPPRTDALVQHGWSLQDPLRAHFADFPGLGARRYLVFSHGSRTWAAGDGAGAAARARTTPVGAPWLHLLRALGPEALRGEEGGGVLVFPAHGTALLRLRRRDAELAARVRAEHGPSVVCLHADDARDPAVVAAWSAAGHDVRTAGGRRDPRFLLRLAGMLAGASSVVTEGLSTSAWCAASAGVPVRVLGAERAAGPQGEVLRRTWPEMLEPATLEERRAVAGLELGAGDLRAPEELEELLGWTSPARRARAAAVHWAGGPVRKARNVLGLGARRVEGGHEAVAHLPASSWLAHPGEHLPAPSGAVPPLVLLPGVPVAPPAR